MLGTKTARQSIIFQTFECSNECPSNSSVIFEIKTSSFIQILHLCSVLWKITSLYFCSWNLVYIGQKRPSGSNFQTFGWLGKNSPNSSCHIWNQVSFSINLVSLFLVMRDNSLLFQLKLYMIWKKGTHQSPCPIPCPIPSPSMWSLIKFVLW